MLYVYCPRNSNGARDLVAKVKEMGGKIARIKKQLPNITAGDTIVNWGAAHIGSFEKAGTVLNKHVVHNKYNELKALAKESVRVPACALQKQDPDWLARRFNHQGASDLLAGLKVGDYYVRYIPLVREFRVHVWDGSSIRAGMKVPRTDNPHPRFRSYDGGWKLDYGSICQQYITNEVRGQAKKAVAALGYNFGAVDVGLDNNGKAWVLEVNSAPGLEGNTIEAYAKRVRDLCK